jgi:hypothetical protein
MIFLYFHLNLNLALIQYVKRNFWKEKKSEIVEELD